MNHFTTMCKQAAVEMHALFRQGHMTVNVFAVPTDIAAGRNGRIVVTTDKCLPGANCIRPLYGHQTWASVAYQDHFHHLWQALQREPILPIGG